jgi:alpha-beta hydrolase superfamily lysophospholipase
MAVLVALAGLASVRPAGAQFYEVSAADIPGQPGTVIRVDAFQDSPSNAQAYRVLYRSTGLRGEPIAVSGVVIHPLGEPPAQGRNVVAWAHPTTGVARRCGPSMWPMMFTEIPGLADMLARGYVVAATDYPGLGVGGPHPYLIGESEGRAVLDMVRATIAMPEPGANDRFVVWGHSQGGHAALYTGELARQYAPELKLLGVAAAAPATLLAPLFLDDINTRSGRILAAYALWSWWQLFDIPLEGVLRPTAKPAVEQVAADCIEAINQEAGIVEAAQPLSKGFLTADITKVEPWRGLIERNTPGRLRMEVPLFLAQGTADTVVRPQVTNRFMKIVCGQGTPVRFMRVADASHGSIARASATAAVAWMVDRFADRPAPNDC